VFARIRISCRWCGLVCSIFSYLILIWAKPLSSLIVEHSQYIALSSSIYFINSKSCLGWSETYYVQQHNKSVHAIQLMFFFVTSSISKLVSWWVLWNTMLWSNIIQFLTAWDSPFFDPENLSLLITLELDVQHRCFQREDLRERKLCRRKRLPYIDSVPNLC
jgi:hypothetical protein